MTHIRNAKMVYMVPKSVTALFYRKDFSND